MLVFAEGGDLVFFLRRFDLGEAPVGQRIDIDQLVVDGVVQGLAHDALNVGEGLVAGGALLQLFPHVLLLQLRHFEFPEPGDQLAVHDLAVAVPSAGLEVRLLALQPGFQV